MGVNKLLELLIYNAEQLENSTRKEIRDFRKELMTNNKSNVEPKIAKSKVISETWTNLTDQSTRTIHRVKTDNFENKTSQQKSSNQIPVVENKLFTDNGHHQPGVLNNTSISFSQL